MAPLIFVISVTYGLILKLIDSQIILSGQTAIFIVGKIQIAIALVIVGVPEGLPLAISIAIVFSVDQLRKDNLLLKNVKALETAGSLFDIITSKTATLTKGQLNAKYFFAAGEQFFAVRPHINENMLHVIQNLVILNSTVKMDIDDETLSYKPNGQPAEVGMIQFLIQSGLPV